MSTNYHHSNLGDQFKNAVSEALSTGDFKELNILVNNTVTDAISEANRQVKNATGTVKKDFHTTERKTAYSRTTYQTTNQPKKHHAASDTTLPAIKNVGQVSSILYMVLGGIGTGITTAVLLAALICGLIGFVWPTPLLCFLGIAWIGSIFIIRKGIKEKDRLKRMKRYLSLCTGKMYVNISDLAENLGKSTKFILKDIKKMLSLGFFPQGHLDTNETCLMLDDATYREYLKVEKERKAYEQQQIETAKQKKATKSASANNMPPELKTMIQEGQEYIRKLHELNDLIPGEVISNKMYRMESLLKEIFERLEEDPAQMSQMHKLMNYYLPTTIKLLQSYAEFDAISSPGPDIITAKTEIEKTVDTINEAFTELLNKLFQSTIYDVTADAQVLQTMLAKEGLTKNDFSEDKK